jgi:hypothetical protein
MLFLCLNNWVLCYEEAWRSGYIDPLFISVLVRSKRSALRSGRSTPWESAHSITGYEDRWASEPACTKWRGEHSCPLRDSNSAPSAVPSVVNRYSNCTILITVPSASVTYLLIFQTRPQVLQKCPLCCRHQQRATSLFLQVIQHR